MNRASEAWVMGNATTVGERLAYLHWMGLTYMLVGMGISRALAVQQALDKLPAGEKMALANLAERVLPGIDFPKIHLNFTPDRAS